MKVIILTGDARRYLRTVAYPTGGTAGRSRDCFDCTVRCTGCDTTCPDYYVIDLHPTAANFYIEPAQAKSPPPEWTDPPVRPWHRRRTPQVRRGRHVKAPLPRGRCRAWRSLKEKRRAWGIS